MGAPHSRVRSVWRQDAAEKATELWAPAMYTKWEGGGPAWGEGSLGSGSWLSAPPPSPGHLHFCNWGLDTPQVLCCSGVPETPNWESWVPHRASTLSPIPPLAHGQHSRLGAIKVCSQGTCPESPKARGSASAEAQPGICWHFIGFGLQLGAHLSPVSNLLCRSEGLGACELTSIWD